MKKHILVALITSALGLHAQDGSHDLSFNGTGYTLYPGWTPGSQFRDAVVQPDGKIVAAGYYLTGGGSKNFPAVFRYNADGSVDNTWNGIGYLLDTVGDRGLYADAMGIQSNGRILAGGPSQDCGAGTCMFVFGIGAYTPDGKTDSTWGGESQVRVYTGGDASGLMDLQVMPDDRVVAAGYLNAGGSWQMQVVRLLQDGALDNTFSGDGSTFLDLGSGTEMALGLNVDPDGKVVMVGYSTAAGEEDAIIARLNADGSPDATFGGGDGWERITIPGTFERLDAVCRLQNGKYFAVGTSAPSGAAASRIYARFLPDGTLDASYSTDGYDIGNLLALPYPSTAATSVIALPDNKVVVGGWYIGDVISDGFVQRLDSTGTPDITFADGGMDTLDVAAAYYNHFSNVVQQPDGKLVCAGGAQIPASFTTFFHLARYNMDDVIASTHGPATLSLEAFPNPTTGSLRVRLSSPIRRIYVTDIAGNILLRTTGTGKEATLDLTALPAAAYQLLVQDQRGNWQSAPIMVQR